MWNKPTVKQLDKLPDLYETEKTSLEDKVIHMHFFLGGCDWYVAEYDPRERIFFGYAILNNNRQNAEWGYTSFDELVNLRTQLGIEVDRDLHWRPRKAKEINKIK